MIRPAGLDTPGITALEPERHITEVERLDAIRGVSPLHSPVADTPPSHESHSGILEDHIDEIKRDAVTPENAKTELEKYKLSLRKYSPVKRGLPWACEAQCTRCREVAPARFVLDNSEDQVYLEYDCPTCGDWRERHHDVLFVKDLTRLRERQGRNQPTKTHKGFIIRPVVKDLPKTVETLCPECSCNVLGRYYALDNVVYIEKTCPEHGYYRDKISTDAKLYVKATRSIFEDERGVYSPQVDKAHSCPSDCGLCNQHVSTSCLAQIDLTNRCNLTCPVCFANANTAGYVSEPTYEMVVQMLRSLRNQHPYPATAIQFTGGEPTIHPDFHRICSAARGMGFSHIQIATNGITHANLEFAERSAEDGLHNLYLQFDGVDDHFYKKTRGEALFEKKLQCIENCKKAGLKVVLVPTVINNFNDDQVGRIFEFAVEHIDAVSAISYQPVVFTGRINKRELEHKRYTLGDLARDISAVSEADPQRDFWPLSMLTPLSRIMETVDGKTKIRASCHSDCAFGTYFFVTPDKQAIPIPKLFDMYGLMTDFNELTDKIKRKHPDVRLPEANRWELLQIASTFFKNYRWEHFSREIKPWTFVRALQGLTNKSKGRGEAEKKSYKTLMAAGMHFMDRYNYDVERVRRCVIQYSTPDGVYPFCTINGGPSYREYIEKMYAQMNADWQEENPHMALRPSSHPNAVMPWIGRMGQSVEDDETWVGRDGMTSGSLPIVGPSAGGGGCCGSGCGC